VRLSATLVRKVNADDKRQAAQLIRLYPIVLTFGATMFDRNVLTLRSEFFFPVDQPYRPPRQCSSVTLSSAGSPSGFAGFSCQWGDGRDHLLRGTHHPSRLPKLLARENQPLSEAASALRSRHRAV
jgi:hypothetical protein